MFFLRTALVFAVCWPLAALAQPADRGPVTTFGVGQPLRALLFDGLIVAADQSGRILSIDPYAAGRAPVVRAENIPNVLALAISPDRQWAAAASEDSTLYVVQLSQRSPPRALPGAAGARIRQLRFAANGRVVGLAEDKSLLVWDTSGATAAERHHLAGLAMPMTLSRGGDYLVANSDEGKLVLWDVAAGRVLHTFEGVRAADAVGISRNNSYVAAAAGDNVALWDMATGKLLWTQRVGGRTTGMAFFGDDEALLAMGEGKLPRQIDLAPTNRNVLSAPQPLASTHWSCDSNSKAVALGRADGSIDMMPAESLFPAAREQLIVKEFRIVQGEVETDRPYVTVPVYFGTNRAMELPLTWWQAWRGYFWTAVGLGTTIVVVAIILLLGLFFSARISRRAFLGGLLLLFALASVYAQARTMEAPVSGLRYWGSRGPLICGECKVTVPRGHETGELEAPASFWVFKAAEDPAAHVMLQEIRPLDDREFVEAVKKRISASPDADAFVFIHGYNVPFEDAARRTAQLAVDLEFTGVPTFFSWPSHADPLAYPKDLQNAEASWPELVEFLTKLAKDSGAKRIHLVAHSMGNRVLAEALQRMEPDLMNREDTVFRHIVLTAPDIDREVFIKQIAPAMTKNQRQHLTLYASSNDTALLISKAFNGLPRAGDSTPKPVLFKGLDTIDASGVDTSLLGHSYYSDPWAITDLQFLLRQDKLPDSRFGLKRIMDPDGIYWSAKRPAKQ